MKSFRERLGIRQDFDNWSKGINNTLNNLRKQGFENEAQQNVDYLKAQGYQFRQDKNGNEVLSRAGENKQTYKESTQQETEQIKKDLWNVKKAKESEKEKPQPPEPPGEPPEPPIGDGDVFSYAMDFYDLCKILANELSILSPELSGITAGDCTKMFNGVTGGWRGHEEAYKNKAREIYQDYKDYYEILKSRYDDDYIDL